VELPVIHISIINPQPIFDIEEKNLSADLSEKKTVADRLIQRDLYPVASSGNMPQHADKNHLPAKHSPAQSFVQWHLERKALVQSNMYKTTMITLLK
jgi:hypothetical protein